jgi:hypothetical protein
VNPQTAEFCNNACLIPQFDVLLHNYSLTENKIIVVRAAFGLNIAMFEDFGGVGWSLRL